jgi:hypothetical protein
MNRSHHGCFDQTGIAEWKEIKMIVNDLKLMGLFHKMADVQALLHLGIHFRMFGIGLFLQTDSSLPLVIESPDANKVTSNPRSTSPSAMLEDTCSQGPYFLGGVRQAMDDSMAIFMGMMLIQF